MDTNNKVRAAVYFGGPVLIAAILKTWIMLSGSVPFNADEAIVALMARHINQGHVPVFFYGQSYLGSLDAFLVAFGFQIFGEKVWVIRLIQGLLYLGTTCTTMLLAKRIFNTLKAAVISGLLMAVPPVNITLYSTVSLGGYGEMLLIGNILLLVGLKLSREIFRTDFYPGKKFLVRLFLWGIAAGFSFWVIGLSLVYVVPVILVVLHSLLKSHYKKQVWRAGVYVLLGGILGSATWWIHAFTSRSLSVFTELAGGAIADINPTFWMLRPLTRLLNLFLFGGTVLIGLRPPWDIRWLMLPLLPLVLIFWIVVFFHGLLKIKRGQNSLEYSLFVLVGLVLSAGFLFTPYGDDPSGRYFIPLITPMAILGTGLLIDQYNKKPYLQAGLLILILVYNLGGTIQVVKETPPGITTQFDRVTQIDQSYMSELINFLNQEHITRGYTNYWVAYPLAFLSNEKIVFIPSLPYHQDFRYTARDNRYPPYSALLENAEEVAFITTNNPVLNDYLRKQFSAREIYWSENEIGNFRIFYDLSETVHAEEIGLGNTTTP